MSEWSKRWHLNFNSDKCQAITIGNRSLHALGRFKYRLGGSEIYVTIISERGSGVIVDEDLKFDSHVTDKVNKANRILGLIRRTFMPLACLDAYNFMLLYKGLGQTSSGVFEFSLVYFPCQGKSTFLIILL